MTLDVPLPEEDIQQIILEIFKNTKSIPIVKIEPGSNVGEGFLGITASITVEINDEIKYYFLKIAARDERLREITFQRQVFEKEVCFYSKIFPIYDDLCLKYTKKRFGIVPQPIYTSLENFKECIVLDNLVKRGYKVLKGKETLDKEHLMLSLKTYSRLHACGFILKKEYPTVFNELLKDNKFNYNTRIDLRFGFEKLSRGYLDILEKYCSLNQDKHILDNLDKLRDNTEKYLSSVERIEEYSTIIHTDCWRNNLMFKYTENKLESLKLIDFQMWHINSPIFDVIHTIYTTAASKENLNNIDFFLNYYYTCLSEMLIEMGGNPEELYPRKILFEQWKKHASYGLMYGLFITRGLVGGPNCLPNIVQYIKDNHPLHEIFDFDIPNEKEWVDRIKIMVDHFIKNKYVI